MAARRRMGLRLRRMWRVLALCCLVLVLGAGRAPAAFAAAAAGAAWRVLQWPGRQGCRGARAVALRATEEVSRSSDSAWPALFSWFRGTGVDTSDFAVEVAPVDMGPGTPGELGLIADSKLEPGDILAWAPTSLLLTPEKAHGVWGEAIENVPDRLALALLLVHERFVQAEESQWSTYLGMVPTFQGDVSGPSFLWEEDEWEYLEGSDCYVASVKMWQFIENEFEELEQSLFKEHPDSFPADKFTWENFLWASAMVSSRAYGDDAEGQRLCIAPLVDFLNHKAGALQLSRFSNGIVAYAHQGYDPGDQVFVNYGGKSNAEILSQYGFVDETNPFEAVHLRIGEHFDLTDPHADAKRTLLEELLGVEPERGFLKLTARMRAWDATLLPAARVLALGEEDTVPNTVQDLRGPTSARLEANAFDLLVEAMKRRLSEYPASLEEDRLAVQDGKLAERPLLGLQLRVSEQELLKLAQSQMAEIAREIRAQMASQPVASS